MPKDAHIFVLLCKNRPFIDAEYKVADDEPDDESVDIKEEN